MRRKAHIALAALLAMPSSLVAQTWNVDADGDWGVPANWSPASVPNGVGASATLGGVITAPRTVTLDIPVTVGTITVNGINNYTLNGPNPLTFEAASGNAGVTVGGTGDLGDLFVNPGVVLNDTLAANTATGGVLRFAGGVSGSGGIMKSGPGSLELDGPSLFTGPVEVQAGILRGTSSSLTFDIVNNGSVVFAQDVDGTYSGAISGTGGLVKTGSGTLTFTGVNSYTGTSVAVSGTLVATTDSLPGRVSISPLGTFVFDQSFDGTYGDAISSSSLGSGSFVKRGSGTVTLKGTNTFTGATTVAAGTLAVDGSLDGAVTVASGARLAGTGTLGGSVTVQTGGILAPGASIGTLTVGSLTFGGRYEVEYRAPDAGAPLVASGSGQSLRGRNTLLDAGLAPADQDADLVVVTGTATLQPSATIVLQPTGTDASFEEAFTRAGNTNNAIEYLILRGEGGVTGTFVALSDAGATLDYRSAGGAAEDVWLVLTDTTAPVVVTGTAPAPYVLPGTILRPRCDVGVAPGETCAIVEGDLLSFDQNAEGARPGTEADGGAGIVGLARSFDTGIEAGVAYAYRSGDLDLSDGTGTGDLTRHGGILWAEWTDGAMDLRGWFGLGSMTVESRRDTALGSTARADVDATELSLSVEARRWFDTGPALSVSPVLGLDLGRISQDGYTETGAGPENFTAEDTTRNSLATRLGVELRKAGETGGRRYELTGGLGWQHEWSDTSTGISGTYAGDATGAVLSARSPSVSRDRVALDLGGTLWLGDRTALHLGYGLSRGSDLTDQTLGLRLSASF
jgi:autotransporter-associated beta strand protein